jgi:hypothetical protein
MSEQYQQAIAEVTCQTCPLRTVPETYWQQNKRPDINDAKDMAEQIACWRHVAQRACEQVQPIDLHEAVQPNLLMGADVLESLAKHGTDDDVSAQCRELNLTFGDMALEAGIPLEQSALTPAHARIYLLVLAEKLRHVH